MIEFEYIYGQNIHNTLSKDKFLRLIEYCNTNYTNKGTITNLDIKCDSHKNIRLTLNNLNTIKKYNYNIIILNFKSRFNIKMGDNDSYNTALVLQDPGSGTNDIMIISNKGATICLAT